MYSACVTEVERRKYNKNSLLKSFEVIGWKRAYQRRLKESIRKYKKVYIARPL